MIDQEKVEAAIKLLLEGIGEDPTREGLLETPARVARMYGEIAGGMDQSAEEHLSKTFAVASNDLVIERDITFYSLCESSSAAVLWQGRHWLYPQRPCRRAL